MKNKILPIVSGAIVIIAICIVVFIPKGKEEKTVANNTNTTKGTSKVAKNIDRTINEDGNLEIKSEDVEKSNATFIKCKLEDGNEIELIAVKNSEDKINVAFNTCQVCNGSPLAYFIQKNGKLRCENCGNLFSLSSVGKEATGCNPMTIEEQNFTRTENGIVITKDYLTQNENLFANVAKH